MIHKTEAILLKKQDLRETSLFLTFYTMESGKIYGVMKGVRGQRGQYGWSPQIFSLNEIVFYERKDKDVFIVSQCELKDFFGAIRESLERTSYAAYFTDLVNTLTPACEKNEEMFKLLLNGLRLLSGQASPRRSARVFEIKLLALLGLSPRLEACVVCGAVKPEKTPRFSFKNGGILCERCAVKEKEGVPISTGTINFIEHINRSDWERVPRIKVSLDVGQQVEGLLRRFFEYHLHLRLKSLDFMKKTQVIMDERQR
ncbi:MAG: DNA repair protein RecO [Candidatus Omnitrophica bacterium]|nr:DNA repair protein RecO [Candidatus Omnitrophota bacterium]